jgi:hypothetical protein
MKTQLLLTSLLALGLIVGAEVQTAIREHKRGHFARVSKETGNRPGTSQGVKKAPSGLIHDWVGAGFIANSTLSDVLSVLRNYDRYEEFYRPTVIHSRTLETGERDDRFSMVLMNRFFRALCGRDLKGSVIPYFRAASFIGRNCKSHSSARGP